MSCCVKTSWQHLLGVRQPTNLRISLKSTRVVQRKTDETQQKQGEERSKSSHRRSASHTRAGEAASSMAMAAPISPAFGANSLKTRILKTIVVLLRQARLMIGLKNSRCD